MQLDKSAASFYKSQDFLNSVRFLILAKLLKSNFWSKLQRRLLRWAPAGENGVALAELFGELMPVVRHSLEALAKCPYFSVSGRGSSFD